MGLKASAYWVIKEADRPTSYVYTIAYDDKTYQLNCSWYEIDEEGNEIPDSRGNDVEYHRSNAGYLGYLGYLGHEGGVVT